MFLERAIRAYKWLHLRTRQHARSIAINTSLGRDDLSLRGESARSNPFYSDAG